MYTSSYDVYLALCVSVEICEQFAICVAASYCSGAMSISSC